MNKYALITDVEDYLVIRIDEAFYNRVDSWLEAVSRNMDQVANRTLVAPAIGSGEDYEDKFYDGNNKGFISIDDCQEIISISEGDYYGDNPVAIDPTNFITYPKKSPFRRIIRKSGAFIKGMQNIKIEGRFGFFDECPADLTFACAVIVSGIITSYNKGPQTVTSERYVDYQVTYNSDKGWADYQEALAIVERYRKIDF